MKSLTKGALVIIRHELIGIWREPKFWIPFLIPPVLILLAQVFTPPETNMDEGLFLLVGILFSTMGVSLTADSFAGEIERNTLETLLSTPLKKGDLFLGKLLSSSAIPLSLACMGQSFFWWLNHFPISYLILGLSFTLSCGIGVNSFTLYMSLRLKSVRATGQSSLVAVLPLFFLVQIFYPHILKDYHFTSIWVASTSCISFFLLKSSQKRFKQLV